MQPVAWLLIVLTGLVELATANSLQCAMAISYSASFEEHVQPFKIAVHDDFLNTTKLKVSLTRFVDTELEQPEDLDGPPTTIARELAQYWADQYDWKSVEATINAELQQFTALVRPSSSPANYTQEVPLHFVHHESNRADAIPLLFVHGWPGSFLEVAPIIDHLSNPPSDSLPAFHVVAPSIPGYGFSPPPHFPGMGYRAVAATFHALMTRTLGYEKYVFQGGDAGDLINRYAAHDFPESIVSGLSNFWVVPPTMEDIRMYEQKQYANDSDEHYFCALWTGFFESSWGYAQIQQTRPLRLAHAMTDSPVGLAMWIYDSVVMSIEPKRREEVWTMDRVITWTMMHWLNGPYGPFSLYKQGAKDGAISTHSINPLPFVSQPVAISQFPYDIWYLMPLTWAQRGGNVVERTVHAEGGHFPSVTNTSALLQDIWKFFGNSDKSNTSLFNTGTKSKA